LLLLEEQLEREMKLQHVFTVGLLAFTLGCSRTDSNRHAGEAAETVSAPNVRKAEGEKGLIRIEPEMLRDLKITTAPVLRQPVRRVVDLCPSDEQTLR
jgi:hypothetical protein